MQKIQNVVKGVWGYEGEAWFQLFNKYIKFAIEDDASLEYAEQCVGYMNSMPTETVRHLCEASIRYCNDFLSSIGEPEKKFSSPHEVLSLIYPSVLIVPGPVEPSTAILHMELNCEWEPEHGMEWVVRNNIVLYVGAFNGIDPWAQIEPEPWNYA